MKFFVLQFFNTIYTLCIKIFMCILVDICQLLKMSKLSSLDYTIIRRTYDLL